jgi:serine/threonine protein kinase
MPTPQQSAPSPNDPPSDRAVSSSGLVPLLPISESLPTDDVPTIISSTMPRSSPELSLGLHPGTILGHFELLGSIGSGGMASVLKARDTQLDRLVALKILPPQMALDPDSITRFKNEGRAAALLDHDNIARVFFCGEDKGLHFIAFEFVEGENLRHLMERVGKITPTDAVRYMLQICAGLAHAAERGVVHRDIKPSNILITPDGRAKIVDMGLARTLSHQGVNGGVTHSGMTLGTFDYISPEQALDPRKADIRSDIYSLGCTMYHALTGRAPVPEGTAAKKLQAHQSGSVLDPRELNPLVSDELAIVLARMMAKSPGKRYQTPQELIAELSVLARQLNLTAEMASLDPSLLPSQSTTIQILPQPPRFPIILLAGMAMMVLVIVWLVMGNSKSRTTGLTFPEEVPTARGPEIPANTPTNLPSSITAENGIATANSSQQLVELLNSPAVHTIRLLPDVKYDLKTAAPQGISISGRKISLEGPGGNAPATLRLALAPLDDNAPANARPGCLTIAKSELARFRGITFIVAEGTLLEDHVERPVGLHLQDVAQQEFLECRFEADKDLQSLDVAALSVERDLKEAAGIVNFKHCLFNLRRGYGVQLRGRLKVESLECAAAPHPAVFALRADRDGPTEASELQIQHSTMVIDRGSVAEIEDQARWTVLAGYSVFTQMTQPSLPPNMMMSEMPERRGAVVRMLSEKVDLLPAQLRGKAGEPNAYYQIEPFAAKSKGYTFAELSRLPTPLVEEILPFELKQTPLVSDDFLVELQKAEPWRAFRLKANYQPLQVRRAGVGLLGARFLPSRELQQIYPAWPPPVQAETLEAHVKIWWPNPPEEKRDTLPRNIFTEIDAALAALKTGDELLIRHTGPITIPPQTLNKPRLRASIKPEPGSIPILQLAESEYAEPSLFRMVDGEELVLDGLDIRLKPRSTRGSTKPHAVVTVVGGSRQVLLKNCSFTLEPQEDERLSVVNLTQPAGGEMRTTSDRRPAIRMENCFIRGKGRAVVVPGARAFELDFDNCLTVLTGPVVEISPSSKPVGEGQSSRISFSRVTAVLNGPLLDLQAGSMLNAKLPNWIQLDVESDRSLFAAGDRGIPVVRVEGGESRDTASVLNWNSRGTNWFANFTKTAPLMEWLAPNDPQLSKTWEHEAWFTWIQDKEDSSFGRVTFQSFMAARRSLSAMPGDFTVRTASLGPVGDIGVKTNQLLVPQVDR